MGKMMLIAVMLVTGGCGGAMPSAVGPSAQDQEVAIEIVWDGVLAMPRDAVRPAIQWTAPCDASAHDPSITFDGCATSTVWPDGRVDISWSGSISGGWFSYALVGLKGYDSGNDRLAELPEGVSLEKRANVALAEAGL